MGKKVLVDQEIREKLRNMFGCSRKMVWEALNYRTDSDLAKRIRHTAIKLGGQEKQAERVIEI